MSSNRSYLFSMKSILVLFTVFCFVTAQSSCPSLWYNFDGQCYRVLPNISDIVPWGYAERMCQSLDPRGQLPIFKDQILWYEFVVAIQNAIGKYLDSVKSKIKDTTVSMFIPMGGFEMNGSWYWVDGSPVQLNFWQQGQPVQNLGHTQKRCMGFDPQAHDIEWLVVNCSAKFLYGCQLDPNQQMPPVYQDFYSNPVVMISANQACTGDWINLNGVCYQFIDDLLDYGTALSSCTSVHPNATLPEFWTATDYDIFVRYLGNVQSVLHQPIVLGAQRVSAGKPFRNKDNTWPYSTWKLGQPNGTTGTELCLYTSDVDGYMWSSLPCTTKGKVICQLDNRTPMNITPRTKSSVSWTSGHLGVTIHAQALVVSPSEGTMVVVPKFVHFTAICIVVFTFLL